LKYTDLHTDFFQDSLINGKLSIHLREKKNQNQYHFLYNRKQLLKEQHLWNRMEILNLVFTFTFNQFIAYSPNKSNTLFSF